MKDKAAELNETARRDPRKMESACDAPSKSMKQFQELLMEGKRNIAFISRDETRYSLDKLSPYRRLSMLSKLSLK